MAVFHPLERVENLRDGYLKGFEIDGIDGNSAASVALHCSVPITARSLWSRDPISG